MWTVTGVPSPECEMCVLKDDMVCRGMFGWQLTTCSSLGTSKSYVIYCKAVVWCVVQSQIP